MLGVLAALQFSCLCAELLHARPSPSDHVATARWMAATLDWGFLSTTSTRSEGTQVGDAFGNPYSFADAGSGVPYFYASDLDASMIDIFTVGKGNSRASLALSEAELKDTNNSVTACKIGTPLGDPENPPCARLVLSGTLVKLANNTSEYAKAHQALFARHPSFKFYPPGHAFYIAKMEVDGVWLIDAYGGAAIIPPADYFAASLTTTAPPSFRVKSAVSSLPNPADKVGTARWMAKTLDWGVLSTTSTRDQGTHVGNAFGNPYSFADASTGTPYLYASGLDASMIDLFTAQHASPRASLALSEATLMGPDMLRACKIGTFLGDPENPPCARLVLSGTVVKLAKGTAEEKTARAALLARHPSFANYPASHDFFVAKLEVDGVWLIDQYGGAAIIPPAEYFKGDPSPMKYLV